MAPSAIDTLVQTETWNHTHGLMANGVGGSKDLHVTRDGTTLVGNALQERIEKIDPDNCSSGEDDAFFVADLGEVYRQHLRWKKNLKRVKPHYAVKCNPDPRVLGLLAQLGTGFDCASKWEIDQVLNIGVDPSRIIFANPCKTNSYVRWAAQQSVRQMTFDNEEALYKIKKHFPSAELFLRILTDDSGSACQLSQKFGVSLNATHGLLELARSLELNVVGVSFHVGSGATDPKSFDTAVRDARFVFDQASELGFTLRTLDVGGGFVADTFETMAGQLSQSLDEYFPPHIQIIGEPGRYYVAKAFVLATNVIARRSLGNEPGKPSYMLYVNDGVYGNFSGNLFDHQEPQGQVLSSGGRFYYGQESVDEGSDEWHTSSIWGPTCDGIDCISASCAFPVKVETGDWLVFKNMGAYSKCSATRFNGFTHDHDVVYVCSEPGASALLNV